MSDSHSDAFVFFGATGDLAFKRIFPALQAMTRRGDLDVPIIGMGRAGWTLDELRKRVHDSLEHAGGVDADAFAKLSARRQSIPRKPSMPMRRPLRGFMRMSASAASTRSSIGYLSWVSTATSFLGPWTVVAQCWMLSLLVRQAPAPNANDSAVAANPAGIRRAVQVACCISDQAGTGSGPACIIERGQGSKCVLRDRRRGCASHRRSQRKVSAPPDDVH
jgi:hypothetical protein